jgi:hypothetical protein
MNDWTNAVYVSLISRRDSAAMVPKTSDDLPEPETPVKTVSRRLGMSTQTSARLFSRAPRTSMVSWLSAAARTATPRSTRAFVPPVTLWRKEIADRGYFTV